jgi:hypothetical protein
MHPPMPKNAVCHSFPFTFVDQREQRFFVVEMLFSFRNLMTYVPIDRTQFNPITSRKEEKG